MIPKRTSNSRIELVVSFPPSSYTQTDRRILGTRGNSFIHSFTSLCQSIEEKKKLTFEIKNLKNRRKSSQYARCQLNTTGESNFSHLFFPLMKNQKISSKLVSSLPQKTSQYLSKSWIIAGFWRKGCIRQKKHPYLFFISKPLLRRRTLMESTISAYCTKWLVSTSG